MGFPVSYTEVYLPNLLIHFLTFLGLIRTLISLIFRSLGLGDFLDPPESSPDPDRSGWYQPQPGRSRSGSYVTYVPGSVLLIRELLPVGQYSDLVDPPESCAVCLCEFEGWDEVRQLMNCRHVFHKGCLDKWMDCDQKTCPLCRTRFVSDEVVDGVNEIWEASGIGDYSGESPVVSS